MMRVRLKADGRLVEILADGSERAMPPVPPDADARILAPSVAPDRPPQVDAGYARRIRSQTRLTQAEFAARIGVPIETVRNWEQGKRHPRGPATRARPPAKMRQEPSSMPRSARPGRRWRRSSAWAATVTSTSFRPAGCCAMPSSTKSGRGRARSGAC